jgi:nucleotide-binding universal stress UspA family protein
VKRILVATDGSPGADRAVGYAAHWAKNEGAELLIVNVIGGYGLPDSLLQAVTREQHVWLDQMLASQSADTLTKARHIARSAGADRVLIESRTGEVVETVIGVAREKEADVIVVGKRGTGRLAGLLLGSVSQKLVSLAPLPVTIVP